uniref:SJCHGC09730 protein n=1 Tax=Schistosoma japonicum TaxID=6182 RepID=Q5BR12_SCHJA|nr:SJCHGC09730 protein [Schistosoma japonicum]
MTVNEVNSSVVRGMRAVIIFHGRVRLLDAPEKLIGSRLVLKACERDRTAQGRSHMVFSREILVGFVLYLLKLYRR